MKEPSAKIDLEPRLSQAVQSIAKKVADAGGRAFLVGGAVRDALLGTPAKDVDLEVFGLESSVLEKILSEKYTLIAVGKAFGVFKVKGLDLDISIPRRESKSGTGHKGFIIKGDPTLSLEEAARRRDFTINAISYDPISEQFMDPYGGMEDLRHRVLRHVSDPFSEDPLRVLRAMQLVARFELSVAPETLALCKTITLEDLSKERIFMEWEKLLLKGKKISLGLNFLKDSGWLQYYPELQALEGCPQDPIWHPE